MPESWPKRAAPRPRPRRAARLRCRWRRRAQLRRPVGSPQLRARPSAGGSVSSSIGQLFVVTTFGESHGPAVGVVVDGMPPGIRVEGADVQRELDRRRPGQSALTTQRREADQAEILSGLFEGVTLGTPIAMLVRNTGARSADYDALKDVFRPGHADYTYWQKYGVRDHRGGGRASGRETVGRVAAGALAKIALATVGVTIRGGTVQVGDVRAERRDWAEVEKNPVRCPDAGAATRMAER